jgi:hypothetical protein
MSEKHVLLRFKDFLKECSGVEKQHLYHVFSAMRGPDDDMASKEIKRVFTCKIRELIGFDPVLKPLSKRGIKELAKQFEHAGSHWVSHISGALFSLESAELISSDYWRFLNKIRKAYVKNGGK